MEARIVILVIALAFTIGLAVLTGITIAKDGVDVLSGASLLIICMFAFGIIGALREPPPPPGG